VWEFEVGADISISICDALRGRPEVRASTPPGRGARWLVAYSDVWPAAALEPGDHSFGVAENQQLMRKITSDKVSDQLVDYGKTADLGSNSLLRLVVMRCRTVLPWGSEGSKPSLAITSAGCSPARWNGIRS
jgi:hypothetical protein